MEVKQTGCDSEVYFNVKLSYAFVDISKLHNSARKADCGHGLHESSAPPSTATTTTTTDFTTLGGSSSVQQFYSTLVYPQPSPSNQ
jgi:hypothetical protein